MGLVVGVRSPCGTSLSDLSKMMARWVGIDADGAFLDELRTSLVQNSRTAPVGSPSEAVIVFRVLVHRLEIGAEDEGRAVDQEDVVAGADGFVSGLASGFASVMGSGGSGRSGFGRAVQFGAAGRGENRPASSWTVRQTLSSVTAAIAVAIDVARVRDLSPTARQDAGSSMPGARSAARLRDDLQACARPRTWVRSSASRCLERAPGRETSCALRVGDDV